LGEVGEAGRRSVAFGRFFEEKREKRETMVGDVAPWLGGVKECVV
jgi:hypothetical protein